MEVDFGVLLYFFRSVDYDVTEDLFLRYSFRIICLCSLLHSLLLMIEEMDAWYLLSLLKIGLRLF